MPRREAQIVHEGLPHAIRIGVLRGEAGQTIELPAAERPRIVDRSADSVLELARPIGQTGNAPLAALPVPGGQIMEHLGQPVLVEGVGQLLLWKRIGEHELDSGETVGAGGREAVEEAMFIIEHGEVCTEPGHVCLPLLLLRHHDRPVSADARSGRVGLFRGTSSPASGRGHHFLTRPGLAPSSAEPTRRRRRA